MNEPLGRGQGQLLVRPAIVIMIMTSNLLTLMVIFNISLFRHNRALKRNQKL